MGSNGIVEECVQKYFKDLDGVKSLGKDEERELLIRYKEKNDLLARNQLIISNLKYASKLASSFRGRGLNYEDLISEANNGLIESIDKYDLSKDVKLISYAKWWIIQRMQSAIEKHNKMPYSELPLENEVQANDDETVFIPMKCGRNMFEESFIDKDTINDDDSNMFINEIFKCLSEREKDMIDMYYGRNYDKEYTLEDIGIKYGLTKERVRQIIEKSFTKIRSEAILVDSKFLSM